MNNISTTELLVIWKFDCICSFNIIWIYKGYEWISANMNLVIKSSFKWHLNVAKENENMFKTEKNSICFVFYFGWKLEIYFKNICHEYSELRHYLFQMFVNYLNTSTKQNSHIYVISNTFVDKDADIVIILHNL